MKTKKALLLFLLLLGIILLFFSTYKGSPRNEVAEGLLAPDFTVTDISTGEKISLSELNGKVLFVNFWASWCQPCKEEMPSIESLYREMAFDDSFRMITVLYNDNPANGIGYLKENNYSFPVYEDSDNSSAKNFGVTGVPETYLIDKKGILRKRVIGAVEWNSADAKGFIRSLIKE